VLPFFSLLSFSLFFLLHFFFQISFSMSGSVCLHDDDLFFRQMEHEIARLCCTDGSGEEEEATHPPHPPRQPVAAVVPSEAVAAPAEGEEEEDESEWEYRAIAAELNASMAALLRLIRAHADPGKVVMAALRMRNAARAGVRLCDGMIYAARSAGAPFPEQWAARHLGMMANQATATFRAGDHMEAINEARKSVCTAAYYMDRDGLAEFQAETQHFIGRVMSHRAKHLFVK
jgi:hypothetical protein